MASQLRHTKPCSECPWRRTHPAGWLGGYKPEDFTNQVQFDGPPVPCHRTIPPGERDEDNGRVSMCAGALIFMKNSCKSAQHPDFGDAMEQVEADPENVFQWPHEFVAYHSDREGWMKSVCAKMKEGRDPLDDDDADPLDDEDEAELEQHRARADAFFARRAAGER